MPFPHNSVPTIPATPSPNLDLPADAFPSLSRTASIDTVGTEAENRQHKAAEKRDETLRDRVNKLAANMNTAGTDAVMKDGQKPDGTGAQVMTGNLDFGGQKITNHGTPSASGDVANKSYVDAREAAITAAYAAADTAAIAAAKAYTDGTTPRTTAQAMNNQKITGLAAGTVGTDAVNKAQMDAAIALVGGVSPNPWDRNYIVNQSGDTSAAGWVTYADAAGVSPVDGLGGSPNVTWMSVGVSPLRGTGSFELVKDAANRQGQGVAYALTLDSADTNRLLTVAFDMQVTSGTYADGDLSVWVVDDNSGSPRLLPISVSTIAKGARRVVCHVSTNANSVLRFCVHVASASASAYTVLFDAFYFGPAYLPTAAVVTDWQDAGTVVFGGGTPPAIGTNTRNKVQYRRVGDTGRFRYEVRQTAAGTGGTGDYLYRLPAGLSFASSVPLYTGPAPSSSIAYIADARAVAGSLNDGTTQLDLYVVPYDSTHFRLYGVVVTGANAYVHSATAVSWAGAADIALGVEFEVPIAGWQATGAVQPGHRYLWAERFGATAVRVTTTPSKPGEYRARRLGTDTAPTVAPSVADGFRIESGSGISAGGINQYDIFVGRARVVSLVGGYAAAGRTDAVSLDFHGATEAYGAMFAYDPTTGVAQVSVRVAAAADKVGVRPGDLTTTATAYFDLVVADDPVALALASTVHVYATSDAGQSVTGGVTDLQYEDVVRDTHGAWSGTQFTAPVSGLYAVFAVTQTTTSRTLQLYKNGALHSSSQGYGTSGNVNSMYANVVALAQGDAVSIRSDTSGTRDSTATNQTISITRVGDA